MLNAIFAFIASVAIFAAIDLAWLTVMTERFYRPQLGWLMRDSVLLAPSIAFYLVYGLMLTSLVVWPALRVGDARAAAIPGLLLGFGAYATYNLTNAATLKGWPTLLTFVDWTWGAFATCLSAWLSVHCLRALGIGPS